MHIFTNGYHAILQTSGRLDFASFRDDTASNLMPNYGRLVVLGDQTATGDIDIILADGTRETITGQTAAWYNEQNFLVKKVFDTTTSFVTDGLRVYS